MNHFIEACLCALALVFPACASELQPSVATDTAESPLVLDLLAGDLPEPLAAARALQEAGATFELDTMRALHGYGREHVEDARGWLLLARDAVRTETFGFAVRYYRMAIDADAQAAQQPQVLEHLLRVIARFEGAELTEASELVESAYGHGAMPQVQDAMLAAARVGNLQGAQRLSELHDQLAAQ